MTHANLRNEVVGQLLNGVVVSDGIATAGQLTRSQIGLLARAGFRTVVDVREADEPRGFDEPGAVQDAALEYINIPVRFPDDLAFTQFRRVMRERCDQSVMVHCASGNRVGALLIPYLVLDEGRSLRDAQATAAEVGLRSRELAVAAQQYIERTRRMT